MNVERTPDDTERDLPWYVTGSLNEAETDRVAAELESLPDGRARIDDELKAAQRAAGVASALGDVLGRKAEAFAQLQARIATSHPAPSTGAAAHADRGAEAVRYAAVDQRAGARFRPRFAVAALSICAVAIAATSLWLAPVQSMAPYQTLTAASAAAGVTLQVAVSPTVTPDEVRRLADHLGGTLLSGPTARHVYMVALPDGADVARDLDWLRNQPRVLLAQQDLR